MNVTVRPRHPRASARLMYAVHRLLEPTAWWRLVSVLLRRRPTLARLFVDAEKHSKEALFGCRMCGQCALPSTGYACPMSCPKELRNGPCGGVGTDGACEVYPDRRCVWVEGVERAETSTHVTDLDLLIRPADHRKWGQSAWLNYWSGEDVGMATDGAGPVSDAMGRPDRRAS